VGVVGKLAGSSARAGRCRTEPAPSWTSPGRPGAKAGKLGTAPTAAPSRRDRQENFDGRQLLENYAALIDDHARAKPAAAKGRYIRAVTPQRAWARDPRRSGADEGLVELEGAPAEEAVTA
jgi:hypothetical protein